MFSGGDREDNGISSQQRVLGRAGWLEKGLQLLTKHGCSAGPIPLAVLMVKSPPPPRRWQTVMLYANACLGFPTHFGVCSRPSKSFGEDSPAGRISGSMTLVSGVAGGGVTWLSRPSSSPSFMRPSLPAIGIFLLRRYGINTIYMGTGS